MSEEGAPKTWLEEAAEALGPDDLSEALFGALSPFVPVLGPLAHTAVGQLQQAAHRRRLQEFARFVARKVRSHERALAQLRESQSLRDLAARTGTLASQTPEALKREKFANMLANGVEREGDEARGEGLAMAAILDQLEYGAVEMLDRLMKLPYTQSASGFRGGGLRRIPADLRDFRWPHNDGKSLNRLVRAGILEVDWKPENKKHENEFQVRVNPFGVDFYDWLTEPREKG